MGDFDVALGAVEPVRGPGAAGFEIRDPQSREAVEHLVDHHSQWRQLGLERVFADVKVHEPVEAAVAPDYREVVGVRERVSRERHLQILECFAQRVVAAIAEGACVDGAGPRPEAAQAEVMGERRQLETHVDVTGGDRCRSNDKPAGLLGVLGDRSAVCLGHHDGESWSMSARKMS
jgi:hypothetical protein